VLKYNGSNGRIKNIAIKVTLDADNIRYLKTVVKVGIYFVVHSFFYAIVVIPS